MEFFTYRISDVFDRFSSGKNITEERITDAGTFPVYGGNGLRGFTETSNFKGECILIGRQGAKCGNVRYFKGEGYMTDHAIVGVCKPNHNTQFMHYALASLDLNRLSGQAAQPGLSVGMLKKQKILLPSLEDQAKIANVIYRYNNLIENNNRRIALLEKAAQELYKEWFVRFRFPGYENAEFENGIPKDWEYMNLDKVLTVFYGKDHSKLEDGNIPVYGSGGIMRYGNRALYEGESVLIPRKGSLNNIMWVNCPFWTVDTMFYTKALIQNVEKYIYYVLSSLDMASFNAGAALPSMTTDILYHLKIVVPSAELLAKFDDFVSKLYEQRTILEIKNDNLIKQRDLLLPRLMSGKLEV